MDEVAVEGLRVRFGRVQALDDVSAGFRLGVNGVLGPNGAGKTTLFRVLTGALKPDQGALKRLGRPVGEGRELAAYQAGLGYLPQDPEWFDGYTAWDLCTYMAGLRGMPRHARAAAAARALESVDLIEKADEGLGRLSGGQRRRAFIAQAMVHDPPVLVLDEPTSGLDPVQRIQLRELIGRLGERKTILLSTHLVEDLAQIATGIVILDAGKVVWSGSPASLARLGGSHADERQAAMTRYERGFLSALGGPDA